MDTSASRPRGATQLGSLARRLIAPLVCLSLMAAVPFEARAAPKEEILALLILRVLAYDSSLPTRVKGRVSVVLLADSREAGQRDFQRLVAAFQAAAKAITVDGRSVTVVTWISGGEESLDRLFTTDRPAMVFVGETLTDRAAEVVSLTRRHSVLSITGSKKLMEKGVAVGLLPRGNHFGVVVNLPAVRAEGVEFGHEFLSVAEMAP